MAQWRCPDCRAPFGARLFRCPRCQSKKGLVMALNVCLGCTTKFAVGLPRCPHCASTDFCEDGQMAKITAQGGPSDKTLPEAPDDDAVAEVSAIEPLDITEDMAGPAQPVPEPEDEGTEESPSQDGPSASSTEFKTLAAPDYEAWTVEELKEQLAARSLAKSGSKGDLVQRLREDDANAAEPGAE